MGSGAEVSSVALTSWSGEAWSGISAAASALHRARTRCSAMAMSSTASVRLSQTESARMSMYVPTAVKSSVGATLASAKRKSAKRQRCVSWIEAEKSSITIRFFVTFVSPPSERSMT